jgi:hypothetical protein
MLHSSMQDADAEAGSAAGDDTEWDWLAEVAFDHCIEPQFMMFAAGSTRRHLKKVQAGGI